MRCNNCFTELTAQDRFCPVCGTPVGAPPTPPAPPVPPAPEPEIPAGDRCPHCGGAVELADLYCPHCGKPTVVEQTKEKLRVQVCRKCGAEMVPGDRFCQFCGADANIPLDGNRPGGSDDGKKKKKKKKSVLVPILIVVSILLLLGAGFLFAREYLDLGKDEESSSKSDRRDKDEEEEEEKDEKKDKEDEEEEREEAPAPEEKNPTLINVRVQHGDGSSINYELETHQDILLDAMKEAELLEGYEDTYGFFVTTVDGETADEAYGEYWSILKNGDVLIDPIDDCDIDDGDQFEFILETMEEAAAEMESICDLAYNLGEKMTELVDATENPDGYYSEDFYTDDWMQAEACEYGLVHSIFVWEGGRYRMCDVTIGMDSEKVREKMAEWGMEETYFEADSIALYEYNEVDIYYYFNADRKVEMMEMVQYTEQETYIDPCICDPEPASSAYLLPESNSRYMTEADLKNLTHEELCFARNEIYARHGWIFSVPEVAAFFADKDWYVGTTLPANFNSNVLNDYEKTNVNFILNYETANYGGSYY